MLAVFVTAFIPKPTARPVSVVLTEQTPAPEATPESTRFLKRCQVSWYGYEFGGRHTASGEHFDPNGFTAAHRTLPFGTRLLVKTADRQVEVRVNDRGPFVGKKRCLDLSRAAFAALADIRSGRLDADIYVIEP